MTKQVYISSVIGRLTIRHYLIKVDHKYYVIDYCDPRKLKNYLFYGLVERNYNIYEVTKDRTKFIKQANKKYVNGYWDKLLTSIITFCMTDLTEISFITFDYRISQNGKFLGLLELLLIIIICCTLIVKNRKTLDLSSYDCYSFRLKSRVELGKIGLAVANIVYFMILFGWWFMAIFIYSNYIVLIVFAFGSFNFLLFSKFSCFSILNSRIKSKKGNYYDIRTKFFIEEKS